MDRAISSRYRDNVIFEQRIGKSFVNMGAAMISYASTP